MSRPLIQPLFAAFALYLCAPLGDVPWIGVSISAPLFAILAIELALWPGFGRISWSWLVLAAAILAGAGLSAVGNAAAASSEIDLLALLRVGYWLTVFLAVAALASRNGWGRRTAQTLAVGAACVAAVRLADGGLGAAWLSQNDYGFAFSAFTPFLLWAALESRTALGRLASATAAALSIVVTIFNASRSSWATAAIGGFLVAALLLAGSPAARALRVVLACGAIAVLAAGLYAAAPASRTQDVRDHLASLSRLETDKPFQTRLLLLEKAWLMFGENPLLGAGLNRFGEVQVRPAGMIDAPWVNGTDLNRRSPHNAYAKLLAETGLVGTLPFAALLGCLLLRGGPAALRLIHAGETWAAPAFASLAAMSVHLWTLSGLHGTAPWFVYGLTAAVIERSRRTAIGEVWTG